MNLRRQPTSDAEHVSQTIPFDLTSRQSFGVVLRAMRVEAGLSQEALAERARLSVVTVGALERGRRSAPYPATLTKLATALSLAPAACARLEAAAARPSRLRIRSTEPERQVIKVILRVPRGRLVYVVAVESEPDGPT